MEKIMIIFQGGGGGGGIIIREGKMTIPKSSKKIPMSAIYTKLMKIWR